MNLSVFTKAEFHGKKRAMNFAFRIMETHMDLGRYNQPFLDSHLEST